MRILGIVALCAAPLSACGGNQALLASGGEQDFIAMRHITDEYGVAEPDATVPVMVGDEQYAYRIWIHKTKLKIMAQTASMAGAAAAGFVLGLTWGAVKGDIEYEPIQRATVRQFWIIGTGRRCAEKRERNDDGFHGSGARLDEVRQDPGCFGQAVSCFLETEQSFAQSRLLIGKVLVAFSVIGKYPAKLVDDLIHRCDLISLISAVNAVAFP